jgi:hypothetical protein
VGRGSRNGQSVLAKCLVVLVQSGSYATKRAEPWSSVGHATSVPPIRWNHETSSQTFPCKSGAPPGGVLLTIGQNRNKQGNYRFH